MHRKISVLFFSSFHHIQQLTLVSCDKDLVSCFYRQLRVIQSCGVARLIGVLYTTGRFGEFSSTLLIMAGGEGERKKCFIGTFFPWMVLRRIGAVNNADLLSEIISSDGLCTHGLKQRKFVSIGKLIFPRQGIFIFETKSQSCVNSFWFHNGRQPTLK